MGVTPTHASGSAGVQSTQRPEGSHSRPPAAGEQGAAAGSVQGRQSPAMQKGAGGEQLGSGWPSGASQAGGGSVVAPVAGGSGPVESAVVSSVEGEVVAEAEAEPEPVGPRPVLEPSGGAGWRGGGDSEKQPANAAGRSNESAGRRIVVVNGKHPR